MSKIKVTEEFEVESDDGKIKATLKKEDGEFKHVYLRGTGMGGTFFYRKPKDIIKVLEDLEKEATKL